MTSGEEAGPQLRAHAREQKRDGKLAGTRIRQQISELERRIKAQVQALEKGIEPELVSARIAELRSDKTALEQALEELGAARQQVEDEELTERLARLPDLGQALRDASPEVQRQVFEAFDVQIGYDKPNGRVEVSATVSEAVASALENAETLRKEGLEVVATDIAGAGFEPATSGL